MSKPRNRSEGFTIAELIVGMLVLGILASCLFALFATLIASSSLSKQKSIAQTLATNQMEYLKSLPYNSLAVSGGSIVTSTPLPASTTKSLNNITYTIKTSINYIDDAFDGCGPYPNQTVKQELCRNYPPPSGAANPDLNPADYKIIHVTVTNSSNTKLAELDTQVSARVAETASSTGALFVNVIDSNGNPVSGATVAVSDATLSPPVNVADSTDTNGVAVFYGLPPDSNAYDYTISASLSGYSSLSTIIPNGALQPTYSSQKIFTQQSSFVTLTLKPMTSDSLLIETTGTTGTPIASAKVYLKGGYKKYTLTTDTTYYYDSMSPADTRPVSDASGLVGVSNLVPGPYYFCGDAGATSCAVGNTTYYLVAAVPYTGVSPFNPVNVPTYLASSPPTTTFAYGGTNYVQKVRLILTTSSSFPRISTLAPYDASLAAGLNSFAFQITGANLPCTNNPATCQTSIKFTQGASTYTSACTGAAAGTNLSCIVNLTAASAGNTQMVVSSGGNTVTLPASPMIGGMVVTP